MAITNFIPELWAAQMLDVWFNESVFAALVNREYEGLATRGNTVHISGVVAPAIKDYKTGVSGARTTAADAISDTGVDLLIDQEKSFDFYVDDIDRAQATGTLEAYTTAAGQGLTADSETFLGNLLVAGGTPATTTAIPDTGDEAFDVVRDLRKQMNKAKVPADSRVLVVNAEFESLLLGANSKLTAVNVSGDNSGLRNATLGQLLSFRTVVTNYLPAVDAPQAVAFNTRCAAFVSQIDQTEGMRAQDKFADRIRGLHVYGGKVVRPEGVIVFNPSGS